MFALKEWDISIIFLIPNAFINVEIFNAHSTCPYSLTQKFGVKVSCIFLLSLPKHECKTREDVNRVYKRPVYRIYDYLLLSLLILFFIELNNLINYVFLSKCLIAYLKKSLIF